MLIDLTPSELMALRTLITEYMVLDNPARVEVFVDVIRNVETTPEQLLARLMGLDLADTDVVVRAADPSEG